jgi:hypothetical protein
MFPGLTPWLRQSASERTLPRMNSSSGYIGTNNELQKAQYNWNSLPI